MEDVKLIDLINIDALQKIQDGFSEYTGMAAITIDVDGTPITRESGFTRFCFELTRKTELGCRNCEKCDRDGAFRTREKGKAVAYVCHAGLMDFAAPIIVEGKIIGGFIGGQVRIHETDEAVITARAIEYGIDPKEYIAAANETSILARENVERAANFIEEIASALSLMAYKSYLELKESEHMWRVAQSQTDYVMNMSMNLEPVMKRWFKIIDNTMKTTSDEQVLSILSALNDDGREVADSINDTISYIKMAADDVEISENEYSISNLVEVLSDNFVDKVSINVGETEHEKLFGDYARIGQMLTKIVKDILEKKDGGIELYLSTKQKHYATFLNIKILDRLTGYSDTDVERFRSSFYRNDKEIFEEKNEKNLWLSLEGMLLRSMSGKIIIDKLEDDMTLEISIPQIGL